MCYKNDKHRLLEQQLVEKIKGVPEFLSDYLLTLKSSRTKINNWGLIADLFSYLVANEHINVNSIKEVNPFDVNEITSTHIIKYFDYLIREKRNSLATVNTKKAILGGFWTYLLSVECTNKNIVYQIPKGKYKEENTEKVVAIPQDGQLGNFLFNIRNGNSNDFDCIRNTTIVKLFIGSGIRSEELIGLDMEDLYIDEVKPYILVMGKGKNEVQDKVLLSDEAVDYLEEYLEYRKAFIEEKRSNDAALFLSNRGTRMSKTAIRNFFERYSNKEIYPHMLRHLCGTRLYNATNNIMIVQKQLRHKDIATAAKYYVHVSDDDIYDAVSGL